MEVKIAEKVCVILGLRHSAEAFFDFIEASPDSSIIVDFSNVSFMSRTFAHEYVTRKKKSTKYIDETNVPEDVRKMFEVVKKPRPKIPLPKSTLRIIDDVDSAFS